MAIIYKHNVVFAVSASPRATRVMGAIKNQEHQCSAISLETRDKLFRSLCQNVSNKCILWYLTSKNKPQPIEHWSRSLLRCSCWLLLWQVAHSSFLFFVARLLTGLLVHLNMHIFPEQSSNSPPFCCRWLVWSIDNSYTNSNSNSYNI